MYFIDFDGTLIGEIPKPKTTNRLIRFFMGIRILQKEPRLHFNLPFNILTARYPEDRIWIKLWSLKNKMPVQKILAVKEHDNKIWELKPEDIYMDADKSIVRMVTNKIWEDKALGCFVGLI